MAASSSFAQRMNLIHTAPLNKAVVMCNRITRAFGQVYAATGNRFPGDQAHDLNAPTSIGRAMRRIISEKHLRY